MKTRKSKFSVYAVLIFIVAVAIGLYAISGYFFGKAATMAADVVYEMTNKHIDWTYAGKDGTGR